MARNPLCKNYSACLLRASKRKKTKLFNCDNCRGFEPDVKDALEWVLESDRCRIFWRIVFYPESRGMYKDEL